MKREVFNLALGVAALGLLGLAGNAFSGDNPVVLEGCGPEGSCHKVCRPITETRNLPKRCYSSGCEDFCLPKCGLLGCLWGHKCCDQEGDGCAGRCEHVRTRRYLIVKIQQKEECVTRCVVEQQACPAQPPCIEPGPSTPPPPPKKMVQMPHVLEHLLSDK